MLKIRDKHFIRALLDKKKRGSDDDLNKIVDLAKKIDLKLLVKNAALQDEDVQLYEFAGLLTQEECMDIILYNYPGGVDPSSTSDLKTSEGLETKEDEQIMQIEESENEGSVSNDLETPMLINAPSLSLTEEENEFWEKLSTHLSQKDEDSNDKK
mmetsp:Transcript_31400/g.48017  ORF Transcript_31400/g.48017 Transcript_31400/m.48017 type:complete len:155 (+) Transcript_31400:315-779(+)